MENILLSISGPTAIGKTRWAIELSRAFGAEILSSDSRQFYREMPIGTAQPSREELNQAKHHFIGHRSVTEPYSVGDFRADALEKLRGLYQKNPVAIMVGGSGLYLDAVTEGLDTFPAVPAAVRTSLDNLLQSEGIGALQEELKKQDPEYYAKVDPKNPRRLLRALEVSMASGKPYSSFLGNRRPPDFFRHLPYAIRAPREVVYRRIEQRVDRMMEGGLLDEARSLFDKRDLPALQTVGYQELFSYFQGAWDLATAVSEIKKNTRRFAKRQGTWLRRHPEIRWIDYQEPVEAVVERIKGELTQGQ